MIHLAGSVVNIDGRIIQRCLVCGYKLLDVDMKNTVAVGGGIPAGHPLGMLVEVYEHDPDGLPTIYVPIAATTKSTFDKPWDDCCIVLVEK